MNVVVVGAGAFGGWSAFQLLREGARVTLVDAWGPGHSRASSGGESRVIRGTYGPRAVYSHWVARALELWREFEKRSGQQLYHRTGMIWLVGEDDAYEKAALPALREAGLEVEALDIETCRKRFPQIHFEGVPWALYEVDAGYLLARRACQAVLAAFLEGGGRYEQQLANPKRVRSKISGVELSNGTVLEADAYVFACGPWLSQLFPELGADLVTPTRQEIYYFGTAAGDSRYLEEACPAWIDNGRRTFYGIPGSEWRGFKIADDSHGDVVDPTTMDRRPNESSITAARDYMEFRFPGMKDAPLVEARVCQYENSVDDEFLIDRHPELMDVWIVGGGSGHGFKHGPALGEHVAKLVRGIAEPEPLFSLSRLSRA